MRAKEKRNEPQRHGGTEKTRQKGKAKGGLIFANLH
jgi:hypothetical protein